jgi:alpha-tubulin suppressor-like RCC1 family protein
MMRRSGDQKKVIRHRPRRLATRGLAVAAAAGLAVCSLPAVSRAATSAPSASTARMAAAPTARSLFGWGPNFWGELGIGSTLNMAAFPEAVRLPAGTQVTAAAIGCRDGYALTDQGQVMAWGDNSSGALGNGTQTDSSVPVPVSLPPGTTVTSIQAGCLNALALTSTGEVLAWGEHPVDGLPGDCSTEACITIPVPVQFPAGTTITAVSAGGFMDLALTATGQVYAWGDNDQGQLGDGLEGSQASSSTPVLVHIPAGIKITAISAGVDHSLAITAGGGVLAWGENVSGALGTGDTTNRDVPASVSLLSGLKVTSVSAGDFTSMALTSSSQVLTWGDNQHGQLGTGTSADFSTLPALVTLPAGSGLVTAISSGFAHDVALTSTGSVYSWGLAFYLGEGSIAKRPDPPVQADLPAGAKATAIAPGPDAGSTLAIVPSTGP